MGNYLEKPRDCFDYIETIQTKCIIKKLRKQIFNNHYEKYEVLKDNQMNGIGDLLHSFQRTIWKGNFSSPVEKNLHNGAKVLGLGYGTKSLLNDLCNEYPKSSFVGIGHKETFISGDNKNLKFITHNFLKNGIPYEDNTFDFIYMNIMTKCFTCVEWKNLIAPEIFRVCKPGGWIEIIDSDFRIYNAGPKTELCSKKWLSATGISSNKIPNLNKLQNIVNSYQELNFTTIKEKICPWYPIQTKYSDEPYEIVSEFLDLVYPCMAKRLDLNREDYTKLSAQTIVEIAENKTYSKSYRMITQKIIH
ncbi:4567_t:CDS:2 [Funneliformis mosseae]|uniref:4567_t:CDS:1 n=1 Tax=Funneliformis mosseae TaxID=27381 RepID=A0A9N9A0Z1_FUNMO|nr:4567_t:CDS:2 [Funneliformis mosseae]